MCSAVFLGVFRSLAEFGNKALIKIYPTDYSDVLTYYMRERIFRVIFEDEHSGTIQIQADRLQKFRSYSLPTLHLRNSNYKRYSTTFADDTVIL